MAFTVFAPALAQQDITISVTGTITTGEDVNGIFGPPNTNLAGMPFNIVYTLVAGSGTQTDSCTDQIIEASECTSGVTGAAGGVTIQVGSSLPYLDNSPESVSRVATAGSPRLYDLILTSSDTSLNLGGSVSTLAEPWSPDFDWRSPFTAPHTDSFLVGPDSSFSIAGGMAYAQLYPLAITEQGPSPCSATSVTLTINNTSTGTCLTGENFWMTCQPNILGGSVTIPGQPFPSGNQGTTLAVSVAPLSLGTWGSK